MVINKKMKIKKQTNILVDYLLTTRKKFGDYKTQKTFFCHHSHKKKKIAAVVKFCLRKPLVLGDYSISQGLVESIGYWVGYQWNPKLNGSYFGVIELFVVQQWTNFYPSTFYYLSSDFKKQLIFLFYNSKFANID